MNDAYFRLLIEGVKDYGIFMLDPDGYISSWNMGASRIKGYEADEVLGKHFSVFYTTEDIEAQKPQIELRDAIAFGKYEEEGWRVRKDKSTFWANVVITALYDANNQLIGFAKVTRDLTERRIAEQALQESRERYRQLSIELTVANAELKQTNQELEHFAYIASHDLQEPLRKIQSFGDLLKSRHASDLSESGNNLIDRMQSAAFRMQSLIRELLTYSQINNQNQSFDTVPLNTILSDVLTDLDDVIREKQATVHIDPLPIVQGSTFQLRQLFQNLLSNALKFSKAGQPPLISINIKQASRQEIPSSLSSTHPFWYVISITDNGIGFDERYKDQIFQMFKRLHNTSQYQGTGIGLAICKKIVDNHGGAVTVASTPGVGSTFTIYLPLQN